MFIEGEPGNTCRNYPNSDFKTYRECDDKYMRKRVDRIAPGLDLIPVWMTEDLSEVTTKPAIVSLKATGNSAISANLKHLFPGPLENLWSGVDESNCPLPCEIFSTETKVVMKNSGDNFIGFGLDFQQTVEVVFLVATFFVVTGFLTFSFVVGTVVDSKTGRGLELSSGKDSMLHLSFGLWPSFSK